MTEQLRLSPIGYVECPVTEGRLPDGWEAIESRIVLHPELAGGLEGLKARRKLLVVFWFHRSEGFELLQHPKGDVARPKRGVFTLRSPHRPNPIGITVVDLLAIEGNVLRVRGLDAFDGTPVLDIKPVRNGTEG